MRSVTQAATAVAEIASASSEQQTGINQVNEAVVLMDEVTQRNAALVEEAAAAASSLEESTRQMMQAISVFNLDSNTAAPVALMRTGAAPARQQLKLGRAA
jgi:methyl-accepting chemotaxis protein